MWMGNMLLYNVDSTFEHKLIIFQHAEDIFVKEARDVLKNKNISEFLLWFHGLRSTPSLPQIYSGAWDQCARSS